MITDGELASLPMEIIDQLNKPLRDRFLIMAKGGKPLFRGSHLNFRYVGSLPNEQ